TAPIYSENPLSMTNQIAIDEAMLFHFAPFSYDLDTSYTMYCVHDCQVHTLDGQLAPFLKSDFQVERG
ncbi:MAG TPA: hypothetical protein VJZ27_03400, partial [Aggregatilineales bacterium]|nr:hypothetical protein [Aggregatilineales bacterium]